MREQPYFFEVLRVSGGNGKLSGVTAVARVLPRDWDGHRLLRFLTGLAMLALAFAAQLAPGHLATAAPAPAVSAVAVAPVVPVAPAVPVAADSPAPAEPVSVPAAPVAVGAIVIAAAPMVPAAAAATALTVLIVLSGLFGRTYAVRGPPRL